MSRTSGSIKCLISPGNGATANGLPKAPARLLRRVAEATIYAIFFLQPLVTSPSAIAVALPNEQDLSAFSCEERRESPVDAAFYLGGGIAFLLALVGWADQIKGLNRSARDREMELVETYDVKWSDLQVVIRPRPAEDPLQRVVKLLHLFPAGLGDDVGPRLLDGFLKLETIRKRLEKFYAARYWVLLVLSAQMLIAGFHTAIGVKWEVGDILYGSLTSGMVVAVLALTALLGQNEANLQRRLDLIEDDLRLARENRSTESNGRS